MPTQGTNTTDILSSGVLTVHVPEIPLAEGEVKENVESTTSRSMVFYDEEIPVYIKLQLEKDFSSILELVAVAIELKIIGAVPSSQRDSVSSSTNSAVEKTYVTRSEIVTHEKLVYKSADVAIWKVSIPVEHPRTRLLHPYALIDAVVNITHEMTDGLEASDRPDSESHHLEDFEPIQEVNLFEALRYGTTGPNDLLSNLSASRVATTTDLTENSPTPPLVTADSTATANTVPPPPPPASDKPALRISKYGGDNKLGKKASADQQQPIESSRYEKLTKLAAAVKLPVFPALNLRLRCTKAMGIQDSLIAVLDLSSSENAKVDVLIKSVKFELLGGTSTPLGLQEVPFKLKPGEDCMLSYTLNHSDVFLLAKEQSGSRIKPVSIVVECVPILLDTLDSSGPIVNTHWDTVVDFDIASVPPKESAPSSVGPENHQQQQQPGLSPIIGGGSSPTFPAAFPKRLTKMNRNVGSTTSVPTISNTGSNSGGGNNNTSGGTGSANRGSMSGNRNWQQLHGLTLSFSGPSAVKVSETFQWKIFAINKSQAVRHLSLYVQPSESMEKSLPKNGDLYPVVGRTSLKRMYQASSLGSVGLICLANDIRLGPLYPQACFETEINLLALSAGVHTLEGLTVMDHATGDSFDCGKLLEVVVNDD